MHGRMLQWGQILSCRREERRIQAKDLSFWIIVIRATSISSPRTIPDLKIVAARPGWPWQAEVIAVLMHKRNIWYELHGWSPKYHTPDLKHEIPRRLKDRILFGGDYPLFSYERLVKDWRAEGYAPEVLDKVFYQNAERFLAEAGVGSPT